MHTCSDERMLVRVCCSVNTPNLVPGCRKQVHVSVEMKPFVCRGQLGVSLLCDGQTSIVDVRDDNNLFLLPALAGRSSGDEAAGDPESPPPLLHRPESAEDPAAGQDTHFPFLGHTAGPQTG